MDLLAILIDPSKVKNMCCLCYKSSENTLGLNENMEIHDEYFEFNSTIGIIMNTLFPSYDIVLAQICEDCSTLIIKLFSLFQRSHLKNELLHYLVDSIEEKIEEVDCTIHLKKKLTRCKLNINYPTNECIMNNSKKTDDYTQCEKCSMKFKSKILLKKHIQILHNNTNNAVICDICGKICTNSARLKAHLDCHTQKQCPYCYKTLKSYSHFKLHVKNHKSPIKIKRTPKYQKCENCEYKSCNKSSLEAHVNRVHLQIKPFTCEICQKCFYKKVHLKEHLTTHNKIKDKTCEVCGDTFVNERTLKEHLRLHLGYKPYLCEICNIGFITSGRRSEHMKRKHMEKTECCYICDKKFSLKKDLNSHIKKVHGAENKLVT